VFAQSSVKPRSHRARQIKLMLKIGSIHTNCVDACQLICIHRMSNVSLSYTLYIGYWTTNNNKWRKCSCGYQTTPAMPNVVACARCERGLTVETICGCTGCGIKKQSPKKTYISRKRLNLNNSNLQILLPRNIA